MALKKPLNIQTIAEIDQEETEKILKLLYYTSTEMGEKTEDMLNLIDNNIVFEYDVKYLKFIEDQVNYFMSKFAKYNSTTCTTRYNSIKAQLENMNQNISSKLSDQENKLQEISDLHISINNLIKNIGQKVDKLYSLDNKKLSPGIFKNIWQAVIGGSLNSVKFWLRETPEHKDEFFNKSTHTPLHLAVMFNHLHIVNYLIKNVKVNVNLQAPHDLKTPLHEAVIKGNNDIVKLLIKAGAIVNVNDFEANTPLHFAILKKDRKIISTLMLAGAINTIPNKQGKTPLQMGTEMFDDYWNYKLDSK